MLQLRNIIKDFGDRRLFAGIDWHIRPADRIGLCGENGTGKTTLLRMLAAQVSADDGEVQCARDTTIGYLPQDGLVHAGRSLFDEVRSALAELIALEEELRSLEARIDAGTSEALLDRYAMAQEAFRHRGGYAIEAEIGRVLGGLGFAEKDWQKPCEAFSGGWQMRIATAKLLLQRPNLLLLDEPTNHLDLPARDWLETYLAEYPFAVVLVSHDRFFLDRVVNRIVELWNGALTEYSGNYSSYVVEREQRIGALRAARQRQDEEIARIQSFINRFRYQANKASQVQSRVKQLEKIVRIEVPPERKRITFRFPAPPKGGRSVMELEGIEHGYGDLRVLRQVDLSIERGERIALVGANGAGKSTLMRLLAGVETPRSGVRREGHQLHLAYFAQDQAKVLTPGRTVLEELTAAAPFDMVPRVRDILGAFLFSGDDVHKPVSVLSGGERNRLALAILLLRPANLLLLDEPTNHLDLQSKDVLLQSLKAYEGTLVFVSHDRYFVDALATRIIEVGGERAVSYLGNYEDFLRCRAAVGDDSHCAERVEQRRAAVAAGNEKPLEPAAGSYEERKAVRREERRRQKLLAEIEAVIESSEENLARMESALVDPGLYDDPKRARQVAEEYQMLQGDIAELYRRWEALQLEETA
ncbi:ABC-F family ATP-binding cassette domain-containing protein [Syntrophotalea acetylenica]|uniref:ABC transporter ATP-binding protein n=1 Tax=Syntrophotalea acetylenica TaxID=29542 RepID=A0A1L3GCG7_SYNAC|nr:ABC-F family ATP-binding cassette domain-containing protein [Syntrophotalea acetylenica]APG23636.1 ABC transporter ATP-binding protein [Syntrophotalea acetylenica]